MYSIAFKNAIVYFGLFLLGISLISFLILRYSSKEIIQRSEQNLSHSAALVQVKFESYLKDLQNDIKHISESPYLSKFLSERNRDSKEMINQEYRSILLSKAEYFQIRFIGIENNGKELLRVERKDNQVIVVPDSLMQQKGSRDYFKEAIEMGKGSLYISPINLNREFNEIVNPYIPTIRVAYPVFLGNELKGIIVINANLNGLFADLNLLISSRDILRIVDQEGHFIIHEDSSKTFGFEFNKVSNFESEFGFNPVEIKTKTNRILADSESYYTIQKLNYPKENYTLYLMVIAIKTELLQSYYEWRRNSFYIIGFSGLAFLLIAFLYLTKQTNELIGITQKLRKFPDTLDSSELPIHRKDEIGELSRGFNEMSEIIKGNIESLKNARIKAEDAVRVKIEFIENISHEIRNPLQSITGLSELLEGINTDPQYLKIIKSLKFNTSNLHNLVNDLLDYKRLIRGEFKLNPVWANAYKVMDDIFSSHTYYSDIKKIKYNLIIDPLLRSKDMLADKTRLSQILHNLLINAINYTSVGGTIELYVKATAGGVLFGVKDNGIGIDTDKIQKITSRYYHAEHEASFTESFGLGLNIVLKLLDQLSSELKVISEIGQGSNFWFELNLDTRESIPQNPEILIYQEGFLLQDKSVLVVDDDKEILELYRHVFEDRVHSISLISNPEELKTLTHQKFDVIIMDSRLNTYSIMDFQSSIEALMHLKTALLLISGTQMDKPNFRFNNLSIPFIKKPFKKDKILDILNREIVRKTYGIPDINSFRQDYDYDALKITKALNILLNEWKRIKIDLTKSVQNQDKNSFDQITHKIITTVRRLDLKLFEEFLNEINSNFKNSKKYNYDQHIQLALEFYMSHIEQIIEHDLV